MGRAKEYNALGSIFYASSARIVDLIFPRRHVRDGQRLSDHSVSLNDRTCVLGLTWEYKHPSLRDLLSYEQQRRLAVLPT